MLDRVLSEERSPSSPVTSPRTLVARCLPPALALAPAFRRVSRGGLVRRARREKLVETRTVFGGGAFFVSVVVVAATRPSRDGAGPRRALLRLAVRAIWTRRAFFPVRAPLLALSLAALSRSPRAAHTQTQSAHLLRGARCLRLPTSSPNFSGSRLVRLSTKPGRFARDDPIVAVVHVSSFVALPPPRQTGVGPRRLRRAAASRSRRRSCLRSARRNAMPCSSRTSNRPRATFVRVDRAHAASASRTASGRGGGGGRGSGAPRRDPRRDAPRRPSVEPSRQRLARLLFSFEPDSETKSPPHT